MSPITISRRHAMLLFGSALAACSDARVAPKKDDADPLARLDPAGNVPRQIRIGITPSRGDATHKLLTPLYAYLTSKLDRDVGGVTAHSYDHLATLVRDGEVELAVFSPAAYVEARRSIDAVAIATATRNGSPTYLGYLVVRAERPWPLLHQLRGKSVAWVNKSSTSGYIFPRAMLRDKGIDPDAFFGEQRFAGDHEAALRAVIDGEVGVAAAASPFVNPETATTVKGAEDRLMVVAKTRRIPLDCVAVHGSLQRDLAMQLRQALLDLVHDDHGVSAALDKSWGLDGFVKPMRYDEVARVMGSEHG